VCTSVQILVTVTRKLSVSLSAFFVHNFNITFISNL
jgi:hypothetical protein